MLRWRLRERGGFRGGVGWGGATGLKAAGRNPNKGEGAGEGEGEKGERGGAVGAGLNEGVPLRDPPPNDTNITAASHSSNSKRERSPGGGWGG